MFCSSGLGKVEISVDLRALGWAVFWATTSSLIYRAQKNSGECLDLKDFRTGLSVWVGSAIGLYKNSKAAVSRNSRTAEEFLFWAL